MSGERTTVLGLRVHVDTDNEEWGRLVGDGIVADVSSTDELLIQMESNGRPLVWVPSSDLSFPETGVEEQ